jgi:DNA-binding CsgD family transcriptional regulator/tetratricopeptide (TPR) repeat protein
MPKRNAAVLDDWYLDMRRSYAFAEFRKAGRAYDDAVKDGACPCFDANLVRARIHLKDDENQAVAFLTDHKPERGTTSEQRGIWSLYLAIGYARMRAFDRADQRFEEASKLLDTSADLATIAYHRGRRFLLAGQIDDARICADSMSCDDSLRARVEQEMLRSFAFSQEERYADEALSLIRAIRMIGARRDGHLEDWFHSVQNLALLARELTLDDAVQLAKKEVDEDVAWPEDFAAQRFQALKAVGWTLALRGDALGCFRYLRMAEHVAPSEAFKAIVVLDRSHFASIVGERNWAQDEAETAEVISAGVDWNATNGEERVGLLLLAETFADRDLEKARFYMARYQALDRIRSPLHLFAFDRRLEAFAAYADGVVRLVGGEKGAEESLRKAWTTFDRIGYDWRAGRAALRLYGLTGKQRWLHLAEDKLERYDRSWLGEELRLVKAGRSYKVELPPMQRKVFEMLSQKMTTSQIAGELGLSPHTVRNHLKAVFKTYGVFNRAALMAEAARRGDIPYADPREVEGLDNSGGGKGTRAARVRPG